MALCPPPIPSPWPPCSGSTALAQSPRLRQAIDGTLAVAAPLLGQHPGAVADLVAAAGLIGGRQEIVVTGDRPDLLAEVRRHWLPVRHRGLG